MKKYLVSSLFVFMFLVLVPLQKAHAADSVTTNASTGSFGGQAVFVGNLNLTSTSGSYDVGFNYGTTASYGNVTPTSAASAPISFTKTINTDACGQTYHYQAFAKHGLDTPLTGADMTTTIICMPNLMTESYSNVTQTSADVLSKIYNTPSSLANASMRGVAYGLDPMSLTLISSETGSFGDGEYTRHLTGLTCNTKYYVEATATNPAGTIKDNVWWTSFKTLACGGTGGTTGTTGVSAAGMTAANNSTSNTTQAVTANGNGTTSATGVATNNNSGSRLGGMPVSPVPMHVKTEKAGSIKADSALLFGYLDQTGGSQNVTYSFAYGTSAETNSGKDLYPHEITPTDKNPMSKPGLFSATASYLTCNSVYYYKAKATDANGVSVYGDTYSTFKTASCPKVSGNNTTTGRASMAGSSAVSPAQKISVVTGNALPPANAMALAQKVLTSLNYLDSSSMNIGSNTFRTSLRIFQYDNRLPMSGKLDAKTVDLLNKKLGSMPVTSENDNGNGGNTGTGSDENNGNGGNTGNNQGGGNGNKSPLGGSVIGAFDDSQADTLSNSQSSKYVFNQNLSYGSTGQDVSELQKILYTKGYLNVSELGDFYGLATMTAVKKFQTDNDIQSTGSVGPMTLSVLNQ